VLEKLYIGAEETIAEVAAAVAEAALEAVVEAAGEIVTGILKD
jgi:hypothetical protein